MDSAAKPRSRVVRYITRSIQRYTLTYGSFQHASIPNPNTVTIAPIFSMIPAFALSVELQWTPGAGCCPMPIITITASHWGLEM